MATRRKGMGKGKGRGYSNLIRKDVKVHQDSGAGKKQAQEIRIELLKRINQKPVMVQDLRPSTIPTRRPPVFRQTIFTNITLGRAFFDGAERGRTSNSNIEIIDKPDKTYLVGYGWAVYGERDKATGQLTYYSGWDGYSQTTSKQISQLGLRAVDNVIDIRKELRDIE